jgi:hypothetical protein
MAHLQGAFDPNAVDYSSERSTLPAGTYGAKIVESDERATKSGNGRLIEFTWEVIDGPYAGRKFWQIVNYINQNPTAQQIGQAQLGRIAQACGFNQAIQSTEPLHGRPCRVTLKVKKQEGYDDKNEVSKVEVYGGAPQAMPPQAPQAAPASPPAQGYAAPPPAAPQPGGSPWGGQAAPPQPDDIPFS